MQRPLNYYNYYLNQIMENFNGAFLRNPYRTNSFEEEQQHNQSESCLTDNKNEEYNPASQDTCNPHDFSFSHLNHYEPEEYDLPNQVENSQSYPFSDQPIKPSYTGQVCITRIHEKYLMESSSPLPKKSYKSERKKTGTNNQSHYLKKNKKHETKPQQDARNKAFNPLTEGFQALSTDSQSLFQSLRQRLKAGQNEKSVIFSQLGLKQPKALGKGRAERDLAAIMSFLQKKQLPAQYVNDFLLLISNCLRLYHSIVSKEFQVSNKINMNSSSKHNQKCTIVKYPVLKPQAKIIALGHAFRWSPSGEPYQFAASRDIGVRKYEVKVESLDQSLKQAQLRYDCTAPILKCLHVQLRSPGSSKEAKIDLYLEHMEVRLLDLKHLLLQEAIYLIVQTLKGYEKLLEKYEKVSVNGGCFGIYSNGHCAVWINRFHEKMRCQSNGKTKPLEIIHQVVKLVKDRSEPVSKAFLGKIEEYVIKKQPDFKEILEFIKRFATKNGVSLPEHLKYLVNQHRIKQNLNSLQSSQRTIQMNKQNHGGVNIIVKGPKTPKFIPQRIKTFAKEDYFTSPKITSRTNDQTMTGKIRKTLGANCDIPTYRSIKNSGPVLKKRHSLWTTQEKNLFQFKTKRKLQTENERSSLSLCSKHQRSRSQSSYANLNMTTNFLKPKNETLTNDLKRNSGFSQNTKAGNSQIQQSNQSTISYEAETIKKIGRNSSIHFYNAEDKGQDKYTLFSPIQEKHEQYGFNQHRPQHSLQPTFHWIPDTLPIDSIQDDIIKANNWTKTFKNLLNTEQKLNISISDGQQMINTYLQQVPLTKLDTLSKQMVISLLRQDSQKQVTEMFDAFSN